MNTIINLFNSKAMYVFLMLDENSFQDCSFSSALYGIRSDSPISVDFCRFEHIKDTSIHLDIPSTVDPCSEFYVTNSSIQGGKLGVYFQSCVHRLALNHLQVLHSDIGLRLLGPFILDHCQIAHCSSIGIYSKEKTEGKFGVVSDCLVSHCPSAISVYNCDLVVRNSHVFRCEYGILAFSCFMLNVHDCIVHDCGNQGVACDRVEVVKIKNNSIYDCTFGIAIQKSQVLQIESNWLMYISSYFFQVTSTQVKYKNGFPCRMHFCFLTRFIKIYQLLLFLCCKIT